MSACQKSFQAKILQNSDGPRGRERERERERERDGFFSIPLRIFGRLRGFFAMLPLFARGELLSKMLYEKERGEREK